MAKTKSVLGTTEGADVFNGYSNDSKRIFAYSKKYANKDIASAFADAYHTPVNTTLSKAELKNASNVVVLELGKVYTGTVKSIDNRGIIFDVPGVKEEIICKENFNDCMDHVQSYLFEHDNKLMFEVREKNRTSAVVSVINGYYKKWCETILEANTTKQALEVHIDSLVRGGYIAHAPIVNLNALTGKNYTSSVFIPGSQIVLNIESDFDRWVGQDVWVIPQNFVEYRDYHTGETYNSLLGSRKQVLQLLGMVNMFEIYQKYVLAQNENVTWENNEMDGTVTGIINSNKKQGIFVELDGKYITGLYPTKNFLKFKQGDPVKVKIKEFELQEGKQPFEVTKKGTPKKCNIRPVFEVVG